MQKQKLLSKSNPKLIKGQSLGYLSFGLHLSPANLSGYNVCASASKGCKAACLNSAGRGRFERTGKARLKKTLFFKEDQKNFLIQLRKEIAAGIKYAEKNQLIPCFRLNLTSDILWERLGIPQEFPTVQFYDYTKHFQRAMNYSKNLLPENYHLTFSRSETNKKSVNAIVVDQLPVNVAVVFNKVPTIYKERKVIDGDEHDLRFLDPEGVIVGLKPKGKAKKDTSNFVI